MSKNKKKPLEERVAIREATQSQAKEKQRLKEESNRLRQQNANKPGYDSAGNRLDEKEKLKVRNKSITEDLEKGIDLEKLREEGTPGFNMLSIQKRDPTVQQGINRDKAANKDFDQILNPDGSYRRPSLGQLREGVDWKKRANQLLMIGAGGAAIVGQGLKSLLINPYGGI